MGKDIDASSIATNTCPAGTTGTCIGFQPIGTNANRFTGTLDGKGFTISDLTINMNLTSGDSRAGLFGYTSGANIRNIGLLNINIDASSSSISSAGGLIGENNSSGSITNSYSTGNVSPSVSFNSFAGGLAGSNINNANISNSYYDQNTSGQANPIGNDVATITCVGGFASDPFKMLTATNTGSCSPWLFSSTGKLLST